MHRARALAVDFDGTLADGGVVAPDTLDALKRAIERRVRLLLVTGRRLPSVERAFPHLELFDRVVAENGAILYEPRRQQSTTLAPPPPESLLDALRRAEVPIVIGRSIVETALPFQHQVQAALRMAHVEWEIVLNRSSLMILPAGVTKVTGLVPALQELGIASEDTAGIGEAEHHQAILAASGYAIAVANAVPSLKTIAHYVTAAPSGAGVVEAIDGLFDGASLVRPER